MIKSSGTSGIGGFKPTSNKTNKWISRINR